ncbi:rep protein [Shigella flexneri]|nr:rep protein [Shigella flexneri]
MEGAKNAYRGSQEVRRADTPNQGLSGRQEPRQLPAKPICTAQAAIRLVGGRRPSVLQRWGSGVLPRRFPVALKAQPETVAARSFWGSGSKNTQGILRRQKSNAG